MRLIKGVFVTLQHDCDCVLIDIRAFATQFLTTCHYFRYDGVVILVICANHGGVCLSASSLEAAIIEELEKSLEALTAMNVAGDNEPLHTPDNRAQSTHVIRSDQANVIEGPSTTRRGRLIDEARIAEESCSSVGRGLVAAPTTPDAATNSEASLRATRLSPVDTPANTDATSAAFAMQTSMTPVGATTNNNNPLLPLPRRQAKPARMASACRASSLPPALQPTAGRPEPKPTATTVAPAAAAFSTLAGGAAKALRSMSSSRSSPRSARQSNVDQRHVADFCSLPESFVTSAQSHSAGDVFVADRANDLNKTPLPPACVAFQAAALHPANTAAPRLASTPAQAQEEASLTSHRSGTLLVCLSDPEASSLSRPDPPAFGNAPHTTGCELPRPVVESTSIRSCQLPQPPAGVKTPGNSSVSTTTAMTTTTTTVSAIAGAGATSVRPPPSAVHPTILCPPPFTLLPVQSVVDAVEPANQTASAMHSCDAVETRRLGAPTALLLAEENASQADDDALVGGHARGAAARSLLHHVTGGAEEEEAYGALSTTSFNSGFEHFELLKAQLYGRQQRQQQQRQQHQQQSYQNPIPECVDCSGGQRLARGCDHPVVHQTRPPHDQHSGAPAQTATLRAASQENHTSYTQAVCQPQLDPLWRHLERVPTARVLPVEQEEGQRSSRGRSQTPEPTAATAGSHASDGMFLPLCCSTPRDLLHCRHLQQHQQLQQPQQQQQQQVLQAQTDKGQASVLLSLLRSHEADVLPAPSNFQHQQRQQTQQQQQQLPAGRPEAGSCRPPPQADAAAVTTAGPPMAGDSAGETCCLPPALAAAAAAAAAAATSATATLKPADVGRTVCEFCQRDFVYPARLLRHRRIHTGERPFRCDYCSKSFTQKIHLKLHVRVHTGERPFRCDRCPYAACDASALRKHITKHSLCHLKTHKHQQKPQQQQPQQPQQQPQQQQQRQLSPGQ